MSVSVLGPLSEVITGELKKFKKMMIDSSSSMKDENVVIAIFERS